MKRKLLALTGMVLTAAMLTGCNYDMVDTVYTYNYGIIQLQNGEVIEGKVDSWTDYDDGEQLQVKINGVIYLTNSYNCTLIKK